MAATAAAMSSSLSPSINTTLKCMMRSNNTNYHLAPHDHLHLRLIASTPTRIHAYHTDHHQPIVSRRVVVLRLPCASVDVAVTQEEVESSPEEVPAVKTKLYFGNLPYSVESSQLAGIIQDYASPELIEVLYHRDTGKSRGFAFVTMSSIEDCNAVIENLDGREYSGRTLRVNFSDKPRAKEPLYPETEYKLFVGNLSWSATSESLTQAFQEYGNVIGGRVLYDGETGRSRGYGFVCFSSKAEMETALQSLDGVELEGRAMRVSLAEGKRS